MPLESGGLSDKLGNRYEGRWIVYQFLRLLDEKIRSVTIEAIGNDEQGVDIWIVNNDGIQEAHQCKARNGSSEYWSISDLITRDILTKAHKQLDSNFDRQFFLVSSVGSGLFKDICDQARRSDDSPRVFYENKVLQGGDKFRKYFERYCEFLSLDPTKADDLNKIFGYLRRIDIHVYHDGQLTYQHLLERIDYLLVAGVSSAESIYATLVTYAENKNRFGSQITVAELRNYLSSQDIHPKHLQHDVRIAPAIKVLQSQFLESIRPLLIGGVPLERKETEHLIEQLNNGKNVVLAGTAGYGKSGVLFELIQHLEKNNIAYLPVRLDRREPKHTSTHFGKELGVQDCPAYALNSISGEGRSVLILDQLDAIRWTSTHSNHALDVCKELVRHVQLLQLDGKQITVVLSCRTFDLEHDPAIKNWLEDDKQQRFIKIEVKELSVERLKSLIGPTFDQIPLKEKGLLACPQNLSMWMQLRQEEGELPTFQSATGLMRKFWENRRLKLDKEAGVSSIQLDQVLNVVIEYVEHHGKISFPERLVDSWPKVVEALCSYGILQKNGNVISFCHQRYLDYLIAVKLLNQIDQGNKSILDWLGPKEKQTLLRREQLRQAFVLISEESPHKFLEIAKQILGSDKVRFNIQHLVLEIIGFQEKVTDEVGQYCLVLLSDTVWQMHALDTIFRARTTYVSFLIDKGLIKRWLESESQDEVNNALWLLQSVAERLPDRVTEILEPYTNKIEWHDRIIKTICWNAVDDSKRMFELRLKLARQGTTRDYVDWQKLCAKFPIRAIQLIEAVASTWEIDDVKDKKSSGNRMESWYGKDETELENSARQIPLETFDYFIPHINRLTSFISDENRESLGKWKKDRFERTRGVGIARGMVDLAIIAGKTLAKNNTQAFLERIRTLENSDSPIIEEMLVEIYPDLPKEYADIGIQWLLNNTTRFRLGDDYSQPPWLPAVSLAKALSPYCSEKVFVQLEQAIINYHDPREKELAKYCLESSRRGYFTHYWGEAQYFFLPALPISRIKKTTVDLIKVLKRKFYPEDRFFNQSRMSGGMVGSKLDPSLDKISDRAWLKIISNTKVKEDHDHKWIQIDPDRVLAASVSQFSDSLRRIAIRYPERFGRLALQFPDDTDSAYISAILTGCSLKKPNANISEDEKVSWKPVSKETVEALLNKFRSGDDRETAISFCRLISSRPEENWSDAIIGRLVHYAQNHPDLETGKLNVKCNQADKDASIDTLYQNSINCVRGVAAEAIAHLLWEHQNADSLAKLQPAIESLVQDKHPSVRIAVINILLPLSNIDKDLAVKWFCIACDDDLRVAASPRAREVFNHLIRGHYEKLGPIIRKMVKSPLNDVAKEGAIEVAARWVFYDFFKEEILACQSGTTPQRQGVALIGSELFRQDSYQIKCQSLLKPLLNDPDKEVRGEIHDLYRGLKSLDKSNIKPFFMEYMASKSFADHSDRFVYYLKEVEGSIIFLADMIFAMYDVFNSTLKKESHESWSHVPHTISDSLTVLLRLYDQSLTQENTLIVNRCLDTWDLLYKNRIGMVRSLTQAIDQG